MKVLGLDISSSIIGYSVLEINKINKIENIQMSFIKLTQDKNIINRIVDARTKILKVFNDVGPDFIGIEDIIKFMPKSTASTVITLTTFNRMICLLSYDYLGKYPKLFNVMSIRHKIKLNNLFPKKEDVPNLIEKHLNIKFPYIYDKKNKIKNISFDMADAAAVALCYYWDLIDKTNKIK